jgi:hypothetical protein
MPMPSSSTRHRLEIPLDLYQALNQAAADAVMPTNALATMWLLRMLQVRRPDLHVRDPYRSGIEQFERRPRRAGELPDDVSLADLLTSTALQDEAEPAPAEPPPTPALLTTVTFSQQKEAILPLSDRPPTQS